MRAPSAVTRRTFLETALYAAVLAGLPERAAAATGMYISLNGATTRGIGGVEKARLAATLGFGGVDWDLGPFKTLGLDASKALFGELKIKPAIVNLPVTNAFAGDDASFEAKLPQLAEDAAFTAGVGCNRMMMTLSPASGLPKDEQRRLVRDRLAAISEVLLKSNLRLGIEFLGPLAFRGNIPNPCPARAGSPRRGAAPAAPRIPFIWQMGEAVELATDSGPNVGVVLDVWHWHHSGSTVADIINAGKSRVVQVHVSDAKPQAAEEVCDSQRLMPGEGIINLVAFFQALQKIGYEDSVSPEPLGRVPMEMTAEEGSKLALDTTLAMMRKAGVK